MHELDEAAFTGRDLADRLGSEAGQAQVEDGEVARRTPCAENPIDLAARGAPPVVRIGGDAGGAGGSGSACIMAVIFR